MIEIRAYYGPWTPVSRERACAFAQRLFYGITVPMSDEERIRLINDRHIRGEKLTLEEVRRCR